MIFIIPPWLIARKNPALRRGVGDIALVVVVVMVMVMVVVMVMVGFKPAGVHCEVDQKFGQWLDAGWWHRLL